MVIGRRIAVVAAIDGVMVDGREDLQATGIPRRRDLNATGNSPDDVIQEELASFPVCATSDEEDVRSLLLNGNGSSTVRLRAHISAQQHL